MQRGKIWNNIIRQENDPLVNQSFHYYEASKAKEHGIVGVFYQRQFQDEQVSRIKDYKAHGIYLMNDTDDLLWQIPPTNPFVKVITGNVRANLRQGAKLADLNVVSTEPLREELKKFCGVESLVVPNFVSSEYIVRHPKPRIGDRLRVLWAGSQTHDGDLQPMIDVIKALPNVIFYVFGYRPANFPDLPNLEYIPGVDFQYYHNRLREVCQGVDMAIAPLEPCRFNECKSNLKLLEYGMNGLPVLTTDIYPYQDNHHMYRIAWNKRQWKRWVEMIEFWSKDEGARFTAAAATLDYAKSFADSDPRNVKYVSELFSRFV